MATVVVLVAVTIVTALTLDDGSSAEWVRYEREERAWSLLHPADWDSQEYSYYSRVYYQFTRFSNRPLGGDVDTAFSSHEPPKFSPQRDGALIEIVTSGGGIPGRAPTAPTTEFPLRLEDARPRARAFDEADPTLAKEWLGEPVLRIDAYVPDPVATSYTENYRIYVWIGPDASDTDRDAVARVVESIRIRPT